MSRICFVLTVLIIIAASPVSAKVEFTFAPEFSFMSGTTEYEMDITYSFIEDTLVPPTRVTWRLTSLLEFPLDTKIGGAGFKINPEIDKSKWSISGGYYRSFTDPGDKMFDSDWQGESPLYEYTQFSYTESDADMKMNILELEFNYRILQKPKFTVSILVGGQYQKIKQNILGVEGWQKRFDPNIYDFEDTVVNFSLYEGEQVGYYEVTYKQLKAGLKADMNLSQALNGEITVAIVPTSFDDYDDHILRFKESTANGDGMGFFGSLGVKYNVVKLFFNYLTLDLSGKQLQEWYGDDPGTPDDDTGLRFPGLPHTVKSSQVKFGAQVEIPL